MHKREIVLGLAAVVSTAAAFMLKQQLNEERARSAQLRSRLSTETVTAEQPAPAARKPGVTTADAARIDQVENTVQMPAPRNDTGRKQDWQSYQRQLMKDPRYVDALREQRRLSYRLRRDNAIHLLGCTPETADAIVDLDVDREIQMMSFDPEAPGDDLRSRYEAPQRDHDAKVLALLGRERFDRWQTYMETRGTRNEVDRLRMRLTGADALRDDQVEPLITALAADQKQMQADLEEYRNSLSWDGDSTESANKFRTRQLEITRAGHKRMLASAGSILSDSQIRRLADMLDNDAEQRATQERMDSLRQKLGPAPNSDAGD